MACLVADLIATIGTYTTFEVTTHLFTVAPHLAYQKKLWIDKARYEARDAIVDDALIEPGRWPRYYLQVNRTFYGRVVSTNSNIDTTKYNTERVIFIGEAVEYIVVQYLSGHVWVWHQQKVLTPAFRLPQLRKMYVYGDGTLVTFRFLSERAQVHIIIVNMRTGIIEANIVEFQNHEYITDICGLYVACRDGWIIGPSGEKKDVKLNEPIYTN